MFSLFIVEPVYICYMNSPAVTYRLTGSVVSLSELLYTLTHVTLINELLTYLLTYVLTVQLCFAPEQKQNTNWVHNFEVKKKFLVTLPNYCKFYFDV